MATALRDLGRRQDAEDAFQATFLALAKAAERLRSKEALPAWLHRTARRAANSIRRGSIRRSQLLERLTEKTKALEFNVDESNTNPAASVADNESTKLLDEEISRLPADLQVAIILCHLEGLTQDVAAKQLGVSPPTIRDRLRKGREILKGKLIRRGVSVTLAGLTTSIVSSSESSAVSSSLIADTTAKSALYAAAEVGVSSNVFLAANKVISAMTTAKLTTIGLAAVAFLALTSALSGVVGSQLGQAQAGTLYIEEFTDTSPDNWIPWHTGRGTVDVVDGELVFAPNSRLDMLLYAKDLVARDASVRVTSRVPETGGGMAITVRGDLNHPDGFYYGLGVGYNPGLGGSIAVSTLSNADGVEKRFFSTQTEMTF